MPDTKSKSNQLSRPVMYTPRSVGLDITNGCNLRCKYCYHFSSPGDVNQDLPTAEWLDFFEELHDCDVMSVTLAGGEPFMRRDLAKLITGISTNRMRFSILSNGTLINDTIAAILADNGHCDSVQISIDGSRSETHDVCRGTGSFVKAVQGLQCLQQHHLSVTVRVTIHKHNVKDLEAIAELLLEELGLPSFSTNAASCMGLFQQNIEQIGIDDTDRTLAMEKLLQLNQKYGNRIHALAGPLAEAKRWNVMEAARQKEKNSIPMGGSLTACGCVWDTIAVRADGIIVPCTMLSHIELGRINKDNLRDIWQNHPEMQKMRDRSHISLTKFPFCQGCDYINYCTGNCPGLAYVTTGRVNHPDSSACLRRFLANGGKLPLVSKTNLNEGMQTLHER